MAHVLLTSAGVRMQVAFAAFFASLIFVTLSMPWGGFLFPGNSSWFALGLAWSCALGGVLALLGAPITGTLVTLLFAGGLAQLWFTDPDWYSAFHLRFRFAVDALMLAALALEAVAAAAALVLRFGLAGLISGILRLGIVRVALVLALSAIATVTLSNEVRGGSAVVYLVKIVIGGTAATVHIAMLAAIISSPDLPTLWRRLNDWRMPGWAVPLALAIFTVAASAMLALFAFRSLGLVEDETAYLFQARTFAAGHLMAPPLPFGTKDAFSFYLLQAAPEGWYATTAPGWPAVLALGVLVGVPWLVNPLLGGLAVFLAHRLTERCTGDRWTANSVALLLAASPWLLATSASLMTHALSLVLILGGWLLLERARYSVSWKTMLFGLTAGLLMGWLFLNRALEGVVVGSLSGLWLVYALRLRGWPVIIAYGLGCIATGALVFPYNAYFTGNPLEAPLAAYLADLWKGTGNDFGFGPHVGPPPDWSLIDVWPGHSPLEGMINLIDGFRALNMELFGWIAGSLLPVWIWLLWGRKGGLAGLMALVAAAVIGIHFFYWFNAIFYVGPRYWYAALPAIAVLAAAGARELASRLEEQGLADARMRIAATLLIAMLFGATIFTPWRAVFKYDARAATGQAIAAARPELANAVVFLSKDDHHAAAILNDPLLRAPEPIFVIDQGPANNARLLTAWPGRHGIYLKVTGKTEKSVSLRPFRPSPGQHD